MTTRVFRKIIIGLAVLWIVIALAYVLPYLSAGGEFKPPISNINITHPANASFSPNLGTFPILTFYYILGGIWVGATIAGIFVLGKKHWKQLAMIPIMGLGIVILLTIFRILTQLITFKSTSTPGVLITTSFIHGAGSVSLLLMLSIFSIILIYVLVSRLRETVNMPKIATHVRLEKHIDKALKILQFGDDIRSSILKAYYELSKMLKFVGVVEKDDYTAREFGDNTIKTVKIDAPALNELIKLFEEARYSDHPLTEQHRDEAIKCLKVIKEKLNYSGKLNNGQL